PRGVSASYVAIITDGNGRWAQQRGLSVAEGHEAGADAVKARLRDAADLGIRELTVYSFSTENWSRSPEEVAALMGMFSERILAETPELHGEGVRMRFIGRREGGRAEIVDAAARYEGGGEEAFAQLLYAPEMHEPELVIRTSGEQRLSNYLLWQTAYSEFISREELWPDFDRAAFE